MPGRFSILFALLVVAGFQTAFASEHLEHLEQVAAPDIHHREIHESTGLTTHTESLSPEGSESSVDGDFKLSIQPMAEESGSSKTTYVAQVDQLDASNEAKIAAVDLWWTDAHGERAMLPLRLVETGHWASLLDLAAAEGRHNLVLLVTRESAEGGVKGVIEKQYQFSLPEASLVPRGIRELSEKLAEPYEPVSATHLDALLPAPTSKPAPAKSAITVGAVLLPFLLLNLIVAALLIGSISAVRWMPQSVRRMLLRQVQRFPGMQAGRQRVQDILSEAGLIEIAPEPEPTPKRARVKKARNKVLPAAATVDETKIERAVVEDEPKPARKAVPEAMDAGKKTQLLIQKLKEENAEGSAPGADQPQDDDDAMSTVEPKARKQLEEMAPVDLTDLSF